jgi:hypothetical protein
LSFKQPVLQDAGLLAVAWGTNVTNSIIIHRRPTTSSYVGYDGYSYIIAAIQTGQTWSDENGYSFELKNMTLTEAYINVTMPTLTSACDPIQPTLVYQQADNCFCKHFSYTFSYDIVSNDTKVYQIRLDARGTPNCPPITYSIVCRVPAGDYVVNCPQNMTLYPQTQMQTLSNMTIAPLATASFGGILT